MLMCWWKSTQEGWEPGDSREAEEEGRKDKAYKNGKWVYRGRPWKAVCRGRLTPGARTPDGETAESNPGK